MMVPGPLKYFNERGKMRRRRKKGKKESGKKKFTRSETIGILRRFPDLNCCHMGSSRGNIIYRNRKTCGTLEEEESE